MVSRAEPGFELGAYEGRFTAPSGGSEGQEYLNGTFRRIDEHVKKKFIVVPPANRPTSHFPLNGECIVIAA